VEPRRRRIDIIMDESFLDGIREIDTAELRARRTMCADLDRELSFYRRLLHGRIDLVDFERRRRRGVEKRTLEEALPDILGDPPSGGPAHDAVTSFDILPPAVPRPGRRPVDRLLGDDVLSRLDTIDDAQLDRFDTALRSEEQKVSRHRKVTQDALDALGDELERRYRMGLTSVDELLHG
jgi:predicted nucleotidyltransferase